MPGIEGPNYFNLIKGTFKNPIANIILNGKQLIYFSLK